MQTSRVKALLGASLLFGFWSYSVGAADGPEQIERLGQDLTCVGAEKQGTPAGTIPHYTGRYLGKVPGWNPEPNSGEHPTDPYAKESPLFVITGQNYDLFADKLSEGQRAMFEQYPSTFRMNIYQGHRDFRYPDFVCERAKYNAERARVTYRGLGYMGMGHTPFPFPETALELLWNHMVPFRAYTDESTRDIASVSANGSIGFGRAEGQCLALSNKPEGRPLTSDGVSAMCRTEVLLPIREKGNVSINHEPYNYSRDKRVVWSYNAGTRRVRLAPGYGFDQPLGGSNGNMTIDEDRLFNGSPERYEWSIVGKREMYIPANAYKPNTAQVSYAELLTPGHANPDFMRYELRRVWVLEGSLKPEFNHIYGKRRLFLDEDTWHAVVADNYDSRGQLWKHAFANYYYHPDSSAWQIGSSFYHDLSSGEYLAYNLTNERRHGPIINRGNLKAYEFTPDRLRAQGR